MSRNTKKDSYKTYLKLRAEELRIDTLINNLGYIELEEPIHHGYIGFFKLREDVARRDNADVLNYLVENYTSAPWCRTKDFIVKKKGRKEIVEPKYLKIRESEYLKVPVKLQSFFTKGWERTWGGGYWEYFSLNLPRHYLVIKKKRDYITHRKVIDSQLISELKFVEDKIWNIVQKTNPYDSATYYDVRWYNKSSRRSDKMICSSIKKYFDYNEDSDFLEFGLAEKTRHGISWYY